MIAITVGGVANFHLDIEMNLIKKDLQGSENRKGYKHPSQLAQ